jgi:hypothetical protein
MSRSSRRSAVPRVKVGAVVGLSDDMGCVREALVIGDRGDLGPGGEQIVRLSYKVDDGREEEETEARVSRLADPPTEPYEDQVWRALAPIRAMMRKERRQARKAATA